MKALLKKSWKKSGLVSNAQKIYLTLIQFNNLIEKGTQIKILSTNVCMRKPPSNLNLQRNLRKSQKNYGF